MIRSNNFPLLFIILCMLIACDTKPTDADKQVNSLSDTIIKKESVQEKPKKEAQIPPNEFFEYIKRKSKFKNLKVFEISQEISLSNAKNILQEINLEEAKALQLNGKKEYIDKMGGKYFYAYEERENFMMLYILLYRNPYSDVIDILTYDKKSQLISNQEIAQDGGDGGWVWTKKCVFLNDTTFTVTSQEDYFSSPKDNFENIYQKSVTQYTIHKDGKITDSPTVYLIKANQDECIKRGLEFFEKYKSKK